MIWRFKSNKAKVAAGMRIIKYDLDGTISLWTGERWSETEIVNDAVTPPPPENNLPVAKGGHISFIVDPKK